MLDPVRSGHAAGLSRLELVVVIGLISVLGAIGAGYARQLDLRYERAALAYGVNHLRAGVAIEYARLAMQGALSEVPRMVGANPMDWLEQPLPGYLGVVPDDASPPRGHWQFHAGRGELHYRLRYPDAAPAGVETGGILRLRVELPKGDGTGSHRPRLRVRGEPRGKVAQGTEN